MNDSLDILLVIPVFNHGKTLPAVVQAAQNTEYQVLVVDDGSDDLSDSFLETLDCETLRLPVNRGKGAAIIAGAKRAKQLGCQAILTIDADGQHNPSDAHLLIQEARQGQWPAIIIGARNMIQDTVPGSSHFGKTFSNFWVRLECGQDLEDTQSGLRLYPVEELLSLRLTRLRYDFEIEALVKSAWAGVDIRSVPVSVHYPPPDERISHFHKFKDNLRLTRLHTALVCRRLIPWPHTRLVPVTQKEKTPLSIGNPFTALKKLCYEHSSPFWLATAVFMGIFLGALPLLACHTVAIIYVCHRLHLNKIAAVAASQFCMPPIVPALCIEVGYFMRTGEFLWDLSWERWLLEIHERLWEWFIGSLLVGPILGIIGGLIMYWTASRIHNVRNGLKIKEDCNSGNN